MTPAEEALRRASSDLHELDARWALIGGLAMAARAEPRFTRDVDIVVAVDSDAAAESLVFRLGHRGYEVGAIIEHEGVGRMSTARLKSPIGGPTTLFVDLLFSSSGIEQEIVSEAEDLLALPGFRLPVARVGHLIALKLLATNDQRPTDAFDLQHLRAVADDAELERAREAIGLITQRGYDRGRDLVGALAELLAV